MRRLALPLATIAVALLYFAVGANATTVASRGDGLYRINGYSPEMLFEGSTEGMGVSPDGEKVVFTPNSGDHSGDLMLYDLESEETTTISSNDEGGMHWSQPRFAPSGTEIIARGDQGLYAIDIDGTDLRRLTSEAGQPQWPVMSKGGYLAYVDGENDLMVLDPTSGGEASVPRLIASGEELEAVTAYPPSFGSIPPPTEVETCIDDPECEANRGPVARGLEEEETELLLYQTGPEDTYVFNVETGEIFLEDHTKHGRMEWNTMQMDSFLEPQLRDVYEVQRVSGGQTLLGTTPAGVFLIQYVRTNQPGSEATIPHASIPVGELIRNFAPYLKYDSQEPYGATEPSAITDLIGWNEDFTEIQYTNELKRGNRVLAARPYEEWMAEEGIAYEPNEEALFELSLTTLGPTYPTAIPPTVSADAEADDYLDEHNDTHQVDGARTYSPGSERAVAFALPSPDGIWIQYWLFYYYNNGVAGFEDHEGDWEMIQVHLKEDSGFLLDEVVFAEHSWASRCEEGEYETEGPAPGWGGAPVVYVANGDHASYPAEGEWESGAFLFPDSVFPDLESRPSIQANIVDSASEGLPWLAWPGSWGASGHSPAGPEFQGTKFEEPTVWAEEAEGCYDNFEGFGERSTSAPQSSTAPRVSLRRAVMRGSRLHIGYTASGLASRGRRPRILLSVDDPADHLAPKAIIVKRVRRQGRLKFPLRLDPKKHWRVSASLIGKHRRSPVVKTWAVRRP